MTNEFLTYPLIFVGGLLASAHCVGMCGGFAMSVGATSISWRANLVRQLVYSVGRLATYGLMGGAIAGLGRKFTQAMPIVEWGQVILALIAGSLLLHEGLKSSGLWRGLRPRPVLPAHLSCPMRSGFASLLKSGQLLPIFVAGFMTGWLPCGLVYAFLAVAAQRGSVFAGSATMLVFGSSTIPLMLATGLAPGLIGLTARRRLMSVASWLVVLTGVLTIARGIAVAQSIDHDKPPNCPFCQSRD